MKKGIVSKVVCLIILTGLYVCTAGCQPKDLTRAEAQTRIQTDPRFATGTRVLAVPWDLSGLYQQIVVFAAGYSSQEKMAVQPPYRAAVASARQGSRERIHLVDLTLVAPLTPVIMSVTGIADESSPGTKRVDFQWQYKTPPPAVLTPLIPAPPYQGQAVFKRYDDGWRVERLTWQPRGSS